MMNLPKPAATCLDQALHLGDLGGRISPSSSAATCCNESNLNVWETMEEALDKPAASYMLE